MKILAPAVFDDTVDVTKRHCSANLSSPGWYRVMDFTDTNAAYLQGATGAEIVFHITRRRTNAGEETHEVKMLCGFNDVLFVDEVSASLSGYQRIDKIRYTYDSNGAHVDIHVNNAAPAVCVDFEVYCEPDRQSMYEAAALASVADAPSGETVSASYDFHRDISTTVKDISSSVSLNFTSLKKTATVHNGIVDLFIETYFDSYIADYEYTIGSIAAEYAPKGDVFFTGHMVDRSFNPRGVVTFAVYANGTMTVRINNTDGNYPILHATYSIF